MKKILFILSLIAAASVAAPIPESAKVGEFFAGCQAYTFRMFDLMEALDKIAAAGGKTVEFFPGQVLDKRVDEKLKFDHNTTVEQRAPVKAKLKALGLTSAGYGVVKLKNDEADCRKIFDL